LDSNIKFAVANERHYNANLGSLTGNDLIFSIHAKEKVNAFDKVRIFFVRQWLQLSCW